MTIDCGQKDATKIFVQLVFEIHKTKIIFVHRKVINWFIKSKELSINIFEFNDSFLNYLLDKKVVLKENSTTIYKFKINIKIIVFLIFAKRYKKNSLEYQPSNLVTAMEDKEIEEEYDIFK
ncbi:hypothetical protein BpHYR1_017985 [Brachionus plicatilis]|uniref:Uncharacterized protein n=1 Tax=Brachionus plicatilis TaxID=10195 RepID=A0A3M7PNI0_BRAPC|nr:hypothetical protein BpHYR1_017985 [Brachionus plicatilis]